MKLQNEKIVIVLTIFIDVLGLGIIIPVLPFYVESFGASPMTLTLLFSVFFPLFFCEWTFPGGTIRQGGPSTCFNCQHSEYRCWMVCFCISRCHMGSISGKDH